MKVSLTCQRGPIPGTAEEIAACRCPKALQIFIRLAPTLSSVLAMALCAAPATTRAESARPAAAFVDFFGVNTHLGYSDTAYRDYEGIVKPRLLELGVRHIRDGTFNDEVLGKYLDLGQHGIRLLFITDSKRAAERTRKLRPVLFAIEGINEPDGAKATGFRASEPSSRAFIKPSRATRQLGTCQWLSPLWRTCATARQSWGT